VVPQMPDVQEKGEREGQESDQAAYGKERDLQKEGTYLEDIE